jgi:predicted xylose isomerase-like sugar epimerase
MITIATLEDVSELNKLINSGYRGEFSKKGWTTEANILEGSRTNDAELKEIISTSKNRLCFAGRKRTTTLFRHVDGIT